MASGIKYSSISESFAKDILKDRVGTGAFETREFYARRNAIVPKVRRRDRDLRELFAGNAEGGDPLEEMMSDR